MSRFHAALVAAILAFFCSLPALAAVSGLVRGIVTVDGKPVSGATVTLEGEGSRFTTTSTAKGGYVFSQVPFGTYRLTATVKDVTPLQISISVTGGQALTLDLPLSSLRQIAQTVVTAHAGVA
ncbi:MAG TPA: carboxypeptidase-like regulatory domain-containing protein, partial [Candidatus Nitrosotalea sp.]|nr:carboxypeptidase-like regulatory domain-containing protein [Candidatus Nitrosotalea sp.]